MDSRINFSAPISLRPKRKLGDRPPQREKAFVLPPDGSPEDDEPEPEPETETDDDAGMLSPQPRREAPTVSRVRLEDEAGQLIDVRG